MRSVWKGAISFGLVHIPCRLYPAAADHDVHFRQLHAACHTPIEYRRTCPRCGTRVEPGDIERGYEVAPDEYVVVGDGDLDDLPLTTTRIVEILDFVALSAVDPLFFERAYYVGPAEGGARPYALLRAVLLRTGRAAVAKVAVRAKESLALIRVVGGVPDGTRLARLPAGGPSGPSRDSGARGAGGANGPSRGSGARGAGGASVGRRAAPERDPESAPEDGLTGGGGTASGPARASAGSDVDSGRGPLPGGPAAAAARRAALAGPSGPSGPSGGPSGPSGAWPGDDDLEMAAPGLPDGPPGCLTIELMRYPDEIRDWRGVDGLPGEMPLPEREVGVATLLVESMSGRWQPGRYRDAYAEALREVIAAKAVGGGLTRSAAAEAEPPGRYADLLAALEASVRQAQESRSAGPGAAQ